jgi:putative integral membrane protein (TIGR02587 family)
MGQAVSSHFGLGFARAVGGGVIFALPLLMTMEMWSLGYSMHPMRLALLLVVNVPLLVGLSHFSGFEETFDWLDDTVDAFVAYAVGFVVSALMLALFGVLTTDATPFEVVSVVAIQAVPTSIGALLAESLFGGEHMVEQGTEGRRDGAPLERRPATYRSQLFIMAAGALFLALNLAPTEEMPMIAYMMRDWQVLVLVALSLLAMHAFVYAVKFRGQEEVPEGASASSVFLRFTVVGYAIALLISAYILWTFGRFDDLSGFELVTTTVVLGFPAALGAAAARLIL